MSITAEDFKKMTGHDPENDDLTRSNCLEAGQAGHGSCGICSKHNQPRFICGCYLEPYPQAKIDDTLSFTKKHIFSLPKKWNGKDVDSCHYSDILLLKGDKKVGEYPITLVVGRRTTVDKNFIRWEIISDISDAVEFEGENVGPCECLPCGAIRFFGRTVRFRIEAVMSSLSIYVEKI